MDADTAPATYASDAGPALTAELALREQMLDASVDCIKVIDVEGRVLQMNLPGRVALGVTAAEAAAGYGMKWLGLLPVEVRDRGRRALRRARAGHPARFAGMSLLTEGREVRVQHWDNILTPLTDVAGRTTAILCVSREVTLQREAERRLRYASERDALTGLLNRRTLRARLTKALVRARSGGTGAGLILIDLDHFKIVNDTLGHAAGDHLLQVFADRLTACLPATASAGRLGGDEFGVCLERVADVEEVRQVAELIRSQLEVPILYRGHHLACGMSLGCAVFPDDAGDEPTLMRQADIALNDAKASGRGAVRLFDATMQEAVDSAAHQLATAEGVLHRGAVVVAYQPKVQLDGGALVGFEALLRWRSEDGELHEASEIAGAFAHYELASGLAEQLHYRVVEDISGWRGRGLPQVPVAFNVAPIELLGGDFSGRLLALLRRWDVDPGLIELEMPESVLQDRGHDVAAGALQPLREAGTRIVLDDFGMGHCSLSSLVDHQVDGLKIDRTLVTRLGTDHGLVPVVRAICALGSALGLEVVAEGVTTEHQRELLQEIGCSRGQGALVGPALDAAEAADLLARSAAAMRAAG